MPENQKDKKDGTAAEDQKERGYYYDDAHGYEKYEPEDEKEEQCEEPPAAKPIEEARTSLGQAALPDLRMWPGRMPLHP